MQRARSHRTRIAAVSILIWQVACSNVEPGTTPEPDPPTPTVPTPAPATIAVTPTLAATGIDGVTTFTANVANASAPAVAWSVNNIVGGSVELGIVSSSGVYTAPSVIPNGDSVVVTAVLQADPTKRATSTVFFKPDNSGQDYFVAIPRVVDATQSAPIRYLVHPIATVSAVTFIPTSGAPIPLTKIGAGVFTFAMDAATATAGYANGTLHNTAGRLDYLHESGVIHQSATLNVNVREAGMPDVTVTPLAQFAQRSSYVLNVRVDTAIIDSDAAVISRALQLLGGNQFDFLVIVSSVNSYNNFFYRVARNDVSGLGRPPFDSSARWGLAAGGRLRGVINYPLDVQFDGAGGGMLHEIGHTWMNHATDDVLGPGLPHWPPSTMALGVMGFSINGFAAGGKFPWAITPLGNGTARINKTVANDLYTSLDLYAMGLLSPDSVPPMHILPGRINVTSFDDGQIHPATTYTIENYVAAMGPRIPSSATSPREFTAACVVLTPGRLMTASEMAYFEAACKRAETKTPLTTRSGLVTVTAPGFYIATGGRATLTTRLP